jgi:hypothetical protein
MNTQTKAKDLKKSTEESSDPGGNVCIKGV